MLKELTLKHNSREWLDFRKSGIGGSDAAAIIGYSPFKTNIQVWEEKTGLTEPPDISGNPQVAYGAAAEDLLAQLFALDNPQYELKVDKTKVYRRGFMFASLDGELTEKSTGALGIYEGKTTEIHQHAALAKWEGRVPDYYYAQILHYFIVTGREFAILNAQIKIMKRGTEEKITRKYNFLRNDLIDDLRYLYTKEKEFWDYKTRGVRPPLILPRLDKNTQ